MRIVITAGVAAALGLAGAGVLGVATAEAPTTSAARTVSVQGVSTESISQSATAAAANAVYRQGMTDAVADGLGKAQLLASAAGAALGPVQSVVEDGGYISCGGEAEYLGEQPDFGASTIAVSPGARATPVLSRPAPAARPVVKHHKRHKRPAAKKANVAACTLRAQVSLAYSLS
jgi:Protein of unknown function (DUF541)